MKVTDKITIYKGDCLELMKSIPSGSIDAIITDPPYGTTACKWDSVIDFDLMWEQLNRIIKPNRAIVLFGSEPFSSALRMSNIKNYKYDWVWQKNRATGVLNAKKQPLRCLENISVFNVKQYNPQGLKAYGKKSRNSKKDSDVYGEGQTKTYIQKFTNYPKQILKFNSVQRTQHPTQKPIALMEYLIKTYTNENETILDFTMGSGSTLVACQNTNRNGIGIEQDEGYFKTAWRRLEQNETQQKLF
jgi:site-specific DNA-methyltransferase (adenine-specific)